MRPMENGEKLEKRINKIKGRTIALVYIFEGDNSSGFEHFFIWKSNVITKWMNAIQELHCLPLILDVRTFVEKAISKTLPHIDFVLNMNSGTYNLSSMALVPATCSSINVPCIPCSAESIVVGENKLLSNLIAHAIGLNVPKTLNIKNNNGIFRPINLGNSLGVTRGMNKDYKDGIYQEFIAGYELTTPISYNAITNKMELLPSVIYLPEDQDLNWYNDEKHKQLRQGYKMKKVNLDKKIVTKYQELVSTISLKNFCRIDARVKCKEQGYYHNPKNDKVLFDDTYFIEINVMPTIRDNNNFCFSFDVIDEKNPFYSLIKVYNHLFDSVNINNFLLANSMLAYL